MMKNGIRSLSGGQRLSNHDNPLLTLDDFTAQELATAKELSPAVDRYLRIIEQTPQTLSEELRAKRHRAWCTASIATLLKKSSAKDICLQWSQDTDRVLIDVWSRMGLTEAGLAFFGLGKWGANELNLSSDIDVIFLSQEAPTAEQFRLVKEFIQTVANVTSWGFGYRVDTDLKPGGRLAPVIASLKQFEDHYWSLGATWERLALVRLRPICGPEIIISATLDIAQHFCFRRFLDYGLLEDLKHLRSQIQMHYPEKDNNTRNLKLAPGGIRDIELFLHALQIIHGGRDKSLRTRSTDQAAKNLRASKRFDVDDLSFLIDSYWRFRDYENLTQAKNDEQTHLINELDTPESFQDFIVRSQKVDEVVANILGRPMRIAALPDTFEDQSAWLRGLGYNETTIEQRWPEMLQLLSAQAKTYKDAELRAKVVRQLVENCAQKALDKDLAFAMTLDFFRSIRARSSLLALLAHENRILEELSLLFGCSQYLGGIIAARPELLDGFLYRSRPSSTETFETRLEDFTEQRLLSEIIAAGQFLRNQSVTEMSASLTATADDITQILLNDLLSQSSEKDIWILALGKWGGRELGLRSDLDFIFVTSDTPTENQQKVGRRFISRLTEQHRGGSIYNVDLRLRPSGRAGPLMVSAASLIEYLGHPSAPWERQSYLRARFIDEASATQKLGVTADQIRKTCMSREVSTEELKQLDQIRIQLIKPVSEDAIDLKYGEGGLVDLEFAVQVAALVNQSDRIGDNTVSMMKALGEIQPEFIHLTKNYREIRRHEQLLQLLAEHATNELPARGATVERAAHFAKSSSEEIFVKMRHLMTESADILKKVDPRRHSH